MFAAAVARAGDRTAIRYFDAELSWAEVDRLSGALAVGLADLGVRPGDRVGVYLQNVPQFVIAMVSAWKAGAIAVSINPMYKRRELAEILNDSGATALVALESLYGEVAKDVVGDTGVSVVVTTSPLDFVDAGRRRRDPGARRRGARPPRGHPRPARARPRPRRRDARAGRSRPGRRRVPHVHLRHDRPAEGRDEHARQRRVQLAGLPRLDAPRRGRQRVRGGAALPHHRPHRARRRLDARADAARALLPLRAGRGARARRARAADVHDRRDHRVHRAAQPQGRRDPRPLVAREGLQRGCADPGGHRRGVRGALRALHPQHLRPDRDDVALARRAPRPPRARGRELGRPVGRRAGLQHGRPHRRRGRPGACAPGRSASS